MRLIMTPTSTSIFAYVGASFVASLLGKVVVTKCFFDYPIVILLLQSATTLLAIELLRVTNVVKLTPYSFERGRQALLPSFLLCIGQWITIASFEGIALPQFDAIKRFTPLIIIAILTFVYKKQALNQAQLTAAAGLCFISFITVSLEFSFDRFSIFYGIVASVIQAFAYIQFEQLSQNFPAIELTYIYSFNSLLVFLIADIVQDEIRDAFMYMMTSAHPLFSFVFAILLLAAIPLQFATFHCLERAGALHTVLASNVRACVQLFAGYFLSLYLFYDVSPGILNYLGLLAIFPATYHYLKVMKCELLPQQIPWTTKS